MPLTVLNIEVPEFQYLHNTVCASIQVPGASSFPTRAQRMPHPTAYCSGLAKAWLKEDFSLSQHSWTISTSFILFSFLIFCLGKRPSFLVLFLYQEVKTSLILAHKHKKLLCNILISSKNKHFKVKA